MRMPILKAILLATAVAALAPAAQAADPAPDPLQAETPPPAADVIVTRDGDTWTADYELERDAPVWAFFRSSLTHETREPWRPEQWQVLTPGVVLERVGNLDILRTVDGSDVPRHLRMALTPSSETLEADYGSLIFTDGSVALFTGAFDVFPLESIDLARTAPDDLNELNIPVDSVRITWRDTSGPVLVDGQHLMEATTQDDSAYVLFGQARMTETPGVVMVADRQLPVWISAEIEAFAPQVIEYYGGRLGLGQTDRPTIMASWRGPTPGMTGFSGSVLPGLIAMSLEGEALLESSTGVLDHSRWFISHEGAHFWLGQTVRYERARDAWITEGGADLMAALATKALVPTYDLRAERQREVDECIDLADHPVSEAGSRGRHTAYYACGAVFAMIAHAAQARHDGGDWFDFLRPLIDANREDGVLTRAEWLDHLTSISGDASLAADIVVMLDQGVEDPQATLAGLFARSGVSFQLQDGSLRLD